MTTLVHEIWEEVDENGNVHPGLCLAGPEGNEARKLMHQFAREEGRTLRLVHTFNAGSYFEAMTIYHRHYGWTDYTTDHASDFEPYPDGRLNVGPG